MNGFYAGGFRNIHTSQPLSNTGQVVMDPQKDTQNVVPVYDHSTTKVKRKKLKGRRAVVKWLKFFRWKKKKEYERMTAEEKILYKMRKVHPLFYLCFILYDMYNLRMIQYLHL